MAKSNAEKLAAAAGVSAIPEGVSPEGGAPLGVEGTSVIEETQKGDLAVAAEPVTEGAPGAIVQQREDEELPPNVQEESTDVEATGNVVDAGGRVTATVIQGKFVIYDGTRLHTARKGDQIKASRAEIDRGVRLGFLAE